MAELDLETIRHALAAAQSAGISEVHLELEGAGFSGVLSTKKPSKNGLEPSLNGSAAAEEPEAESLTPISASCVGFYKPADSVLKLGGRISRGDIVATITALGLANDVESPVDGEVVEVLAVPDQPVEFGQAIAMVRAD